MEHKNKFAAETVLKLQLSLDDVPPYQATELSKQQTIHKLSPHILALRSKGYSWTAVAAMLSERGLAHLGGGPANVSAARSRRDRKRKATYPNKTSSRRPYGHTSTGAATPDHALAVAQPRDAAGPETATTGRSTRVGRRCSTRAGAREPA
jgi:hypothetical protein